MIRYTAYKGCKEFWLSKLIYNHITCTFKSGFSSFLKSVLGTTSALLAAFTCGCIKEDMNNEKKDGSSWIQETEIVMKSQKHIPGDMSLDADIFTFNVDSLGHLDSYQRISGISDGKVLVKSKGGQKRIFVCCNIDLPEKDILNICNEEDLQKSFCRLEDVRRNHHPMMGMTETDTDMAARTVVELKTMTSEVVLRSVRCDFDGTPYDNEPVTDARVYLTNVNAQSSLAGIRTMSQRFINVGRLNMEDIYMFTEPEIIVQEIGADITESPVMKDITLLCFHNCGMDEGPGTPYTRLVLEGKIKGETYYWPVAINRTGDGQGIEANTRYVFDFTIRRKGVRDPDTELYINGSETMMEILQWKEKEEYSVSF